MDKIGNFYDEIKSIWETKEFDKEHAALLMLGADFDNECAIFQGSVKSCVAMIVSAMEGHEELSYLILKASEVFLARRHEQNDVEEE